MGREELQLVLQELLVRQLELRLVQLLVPVLQLEELQQVEEVRELVVLLLQELVHLSLQVPVLVILLQLAKLLRAKLEHT